MSSLEPSGIQSLGALAETTPTYFPECQEQRDLLARSIKASVPEHALTDG